MIHLNQTQSILVLTLVLMFSFVIFAKEPAQPAENIVASYTDYTVFAGDKFSLIEDNLLKGINSNNTGLVTSSAYFLGEMESDKAMIPLLRLAKNGSTEESRIIAGLSLYKIHSKIGMFRLKGLAESDDSELVRKTFVRIYNKYVSNNFSF